MGKYYADKLKGLCEQNLFDLYSCLIMIEVTEQCKLQMQRVFRLNVMDSFLEKLSIFVLWPRLSQIFDLHLDNISKCEPKIYKLYN